MSRRFGRNQKRRAREEITRLTHELVRSVSAHGRDRGLLEYVSERKHELERKIEEMVLAIGRICRYSSALPAPTKATYDKYADRAFLEILMDMGVPCMVGDCDSLRDMRLSAVEVSKLTAFLRRNSELLQTSVHVRFTGYGETCYMLSEKAFYTMDEQLLAKELLPNLIRQLRESKRRG